MASIIESVTNTVAKSFGGKNSQKLLDVRPLDGKVALVTGGTEGIGYGCTYTLLSHEIDKVFALSVREEVEDEALNSIAENLGEDNNGRDKEKMFEESAAKGCPFHGT